MPAGPFDFLLSLPESQARQWLTRYLLGQRTDPAVDVPFDYGRLAFLLNEVSPIPDMALPRRVGDLAGTVLAEVIATRTLHGIPTGLVKALFTLVESLPVSEPIVGFLNTLAATGRLLDWPAAAGTDFHLLILRALVLHQLPPAGQRDRLIDFWAREAEDLRYASVAIQGLLRVSPLHAIDKLPEFAKRALEAVPPVPLANLLLTFSLELGHDERLWRRLASVLFANRAILEAIRRGFASIRLPQTNPAAWHLIQSPVPSPTRGPLGQRMVSAHFVPTGPYLDSDSIEVSSFAPQGGGDTDQSLSFDAPNRRYRRLSHAA